MGRRLGGSQGANGWTAFGWLHTDVLWLAENLRRKGLGREVLKAIEAEAQRRGCKFAKLETFSFQALEFYKKNGYTVFGELDGLVARWEPGCVPLKSKRRLRPVLEIIERRPSYPYVEVGRRQALAWVS